MRKYQSEPGRLARLFKASREKWRARAAAKQKQVRELQIRVRDLEASRENWKGRAQRAEREVAAQKRAAGKAAPSEPEAESEAGALVARADSPPSWERAWRHRYPLWLVQLALYQVVVALTSLRGASRSLAGLAAVGWELASPSATMIRQWVLRLGLYEIQRPRVQGEDWAVIVDLSIELGPLKVLVMVAVPRSRLPPPPPPPALAAPTPALAAPTPALPAPPRALPAPVPSAALGHQDVQVVDLAVLSHSNGKVVHQHLELVGERLGQVSQIMADGGSDLKAGIERYCRAHPQCRYTDDVTHQMARLLQRELEPDERFGAFLAHAQKARQALQQTPLSLLRPPPWRVKGRWLQVGGLIGWAQRTLHYYDQGDFRALEPGYRLDARAYQELLGELEPWALERLHAGTWRDYPDQEALLEALAARLGAASVARHRRALCQATDRGRRRFHDALGGLEAYRSEIGEYAELIELVNRTQQILKTQGLNAHSREHVALALAPRPGGARAQRLTQGIDAYLQRQTQDLPEGQSFLATSDVLESLFGAYKLISERSPLKEVGQLILTLPLRTVKLTAEFVKTALETVSTADLKTWTAETFAPTALARRWAALGRHRTTKNQQEEYDATSG